MIRKLTKPRGRGKRLEGGQNLTKFDLEESLDLRNLSVWGEVVLGVDLDGADLVAHLDDVVAAGVGAVHGHVAGSQRVHPRKLTSHDLEKKFPILPYINTN